MKCDIIVAGVGGQGTLSVSSIIASAAMSEGLSVKQSEVHGMSQRGGAVVTNLRLSDQPIASDLIARGTASVILSIEPLEGLRYLEYLSPDGTLVSSTNPVVNIPISFEQDAGAPLVRRTQNSCNPLFIKQGWLPLARRGRL